jgi:hypothetical protein
MNKIHTSEQANANKNARIAGSLYLLMVPFASFSLYVWFSTFTHDDPIATLNNLSTNAWMIRAGILTWFIQQTIYIFLVLSLYKLFAEVKQAVAVLMVILVLVGVPIAFINELNQVAALLLAIHFSTSLDPVLLQSLTMLFLTLHEYGTVIVHVFWGLWLFPLGYLIIKSKQIPALLGVLLIIAGIGYLVDFLTFLFVPDRTITATKFTVIGELIFPLWLLIKGVKN